ncbi:N-6 DNA methylase [Microcoleus sp. MOSTC5]|uniref:N-6 DNA methylase n=1 Tax=Microcoleus sp. MOSTC5 TaxID=3055378 RepID=UPI0040409329
MLSVFPGNFAQKEGPKGGEFFTPISLVKLIVDVIEPNCGGILDPACGAGGMLVSSGSIKNWVKKKALRDSNYRNLRFD